MPWRRGQAIVGRVSVIEPAGLCQRSAQGREGGVVGLFASDLVTPQGQLVVPHRRPHGGHQGRAQEQAHHRALDQGSPPLAGLDGHGDPCPKEGREAQHGDIEVTLSRDGPEGHEVQDRRDEHHQPKQTQPGFALTGRLSHLDDQRRDHEDKTPHGRQLKPAGRCHRCPG